MESRLAGAMSLQRAAMAHRLKLGGAAIVAAAIALRMARKKGGGNGQKTSKEKKEYDPKKDGVAVSHKDNYHLI